MLSFGSFPSLAESAFFLLGLGVPLLIWKGGSAGISSFMERGKEDFFGD